ncbi:MAG: Ig-like domain-containing protein [Gemmatimonadota bacterium]
MSRSYLGSMTFSTAAALAVIVGGCGHDATDPLSVARVDISPAQDTVVVGDAHQLTAGVYDGSGAALTGRSVTWQSSDDAVATVSGTGVVTGIMPGAVTITATSEGRSGTAAVTVVPVPVASVEVSPDAMSIMVGETGQFAATTKAADGSVLAGRDVAWTSSDTTVATVDSTGLVRALAAGTTLIAATAEGRSASATLTVLPFSWANVALGNAHTCARSSNGDAYCWGNGAYGQIGNGSTEDRSTPVAVTGTQTGYSIATGDNHTCTMNGAHVASCWGYGVSGQLGGGSQPTVQDTPVSVVGGHLWALIDAGGNHTCGVTTDGDAYCWGENQYGQLGSGDTISRSVPVLVAGGHTWDMVLSGTLHSCGLTTDHQAYCWGFNEDGQLGDSTAVNSSTPVAVHGGQTWTQISTGNLHTCGVSMNGYAYCWGWGFDGQLGDGTSGVGAMRLTPTVVSGGHSWTNMIAADSYTCGVTSDGNAYCWGSNTSGQLGDGSTTDHSVPTALAGGLNWYVVVGGGAHTCGLTTAYEIYCWGANDRGQLGDGTTGDHLTPVKVATP